MLVLVCYDVETAEEGQKRLARIAKACTNYGQRVQNSVFECLVTPDRWEMLKAKLLELYKPEKDSLRFYYLGANWRRRVEHFGAKKSYDPEGPLMV